VGYGWVVGVVVDDGATDEVEEVEVELLEPGTDVVEEVDVVVSGGIVEVVVVEASTMTWPKLRSCETSQPDRTR